MIMSINPIKPKNAGTYAIEVSLSDGYAIPFVEHFKIIVEDPLASDRIKRNKAKGDGIPGLSNNKQFEINRGSFKIKKVTRDSKVIIKFICSQKSQNLLKAATFYSFQINWLKYDQEPVPLNFSIDSLNLLETTMTLNLTYPSPQLVSASNVI